MKIKHDKNVLLGYVNINSVRNKILGFFSLLENDFEILTIAVTKLASSFPNSQFLEATNHLLELMCHKKVVV